MNLIDITKIYPHPDNPRKNIGDVSELADSIKENGILQNLTVVPFEDGYRVIIGHRRLAASKQAGLTELPCVIREMTPQEQVKTMLMENMQRSDLTVYEQAQGFQMMLDMGETVESIAKDSGFSQSTVRRRVKLLELDDKKFRKAESRGATLQDYVELEKIEDIERKNKVLDSIGTANFKNELQNALKDQQIMKRMQEWLSVIQTFATEDPEASYSTRDYVISYTQWSLDRDVVIPENADTEKYYYKVGKKEITIYKDRDLKKEEANKAAREERQRVENLRRQQFEDINERHYELRYDFVKNLSNAACKRNAFAVYGFVSNTLFVTADGYTEEMDLDALGDLLGVKIEANYLEEDNRLTEIPGIRSALEAFPTKALFCMAYCLVDDANTGYWRRGWDGGQYTYLHNENPRLNALYETLAALGYEMSDEEKAMQNGSHELFKDGHNESEGQ